MLIYPAHFIYNYFYTQIALRKSNSTIHMQNREMSLLSMKKSYKVLVKRKDIIFRILVTTLMVVFLESLESMYIFKIVDQYLGVIYNYSPANYFNFIELSGARMMSNNVHNFPLLTIVPGNGMAFVEFYMSNVNQVIFINSHMGDLGNNQYTINLSNDFAQQTAFITRLFNVYLPRFLAMIISIRVFSKIVFKKIFK